MTRRNFITSGTIPADVAALDGDQQSRMGYAVDRFAAAGNTAFLVDNAATFAGAYPNLTLSGNVLTVAGEVAVTSTAGITYIVTNKTVRFTTSDSRIYMDSTTSNGVYFVNCYIIIEEAVAPADGIQIIGGFSNHGTAGTGQTGRGRPFAISGGRGSTSTINAYGCTIMNNAANQAYVSFVDAINTDLVVGSTSPNGTLIAPPDGGRWFNYSIRHDYQRLGRIQPYGSPAVSSGVVFDNMDFRTGQNEQNVSELLDRPLFPSPIQTSYFDLNVAIGSGSLTARRNRPAQVIGGPALGDLNGAFGSAPATGQTRGGVLTYDAIGRTVGGYHNYYADNRRYQTIDPQGELVPAQGLRTRLHVNVAAADTTSRGDPANWSASGALAVDNASHTWICSALTNADGIYASEYYQSNAAGTLGVAQAGYIDWLRFSQQTAVGQTVFGENPFGLTTPEGMFIIPFEKGITVDPANAVANLRAPSFTVQGERRAYVLDGTEALTTIAHPDARGNIEIPTGTVVLPDISGTVVKQQHVTADNLPNQVAFDSEFVANASISINDIRDAYRASWSEFATFGDNPRDTLNILFQPTLSTAYEVADNSNSITVRATNLATTAGDTTTTDLNLGTVNMFNGTISGLSLSATAWLNLHKSETVAAVTGGSIAGGYSTDGGDIFFDGVDVSGLNLTVTGGILNIFGNDQNGNRLEASSFGSIVGAGTAAFPVDPVSNTVTIPAPTNGYYAITQRINNVPSQRMTVTRLNAGTPIIFDITNSQFTNQDPNSPDQITIYVKYDSVIGGNVYQESAQTFAFNTDGSPINYVVPLPVTNVLVGSAMPRPDGVTFLALPDGNDVAVNISGANAIVNATLPDGELTNFQSQGLAIEIANQQIYFTSWYNNRGATTDVILSYTAGGAEWDASRITFGSGDTEPYTDIDSGQTVNIPVQQRGADWSRITGTVGTLIEADAGFPELSFPASLQASLSTVAAAVDVSTSVQEIRRGTGYLVGNGSTTDTNGSRLNGIRPKQADYDADINYENIL